MISASADISEEDRQKLRDAGFAEQDIFDICDVAGFFNCTNRMAQGLEMMPNREYHKKDRRSPLPGYFVVDSSRTYNNCSKQPPDRCWPLVESKKAAGT